MPGEGTQTGFAALRPQLLAAGNRAGNSRDRVDPRTAAALPTLHDRYRAALPEVMVARCPDTGQPVDWPMDTEGLDGWFWDYDNPVRRPPAGVPDNWLCMTGAVAVTTPVAAAPFLCRPGPQIPYLLPHLLKQPGIRAVICPVPIGGDSAWAVSYFGPRPAGVQLANLWGTRSYPVYVDGQWLGWAAAEFWSPDNDYALTRWIDDGSLLWIAPDDPDKRLRTGSAGCPWLDLTGNRENAIIEDGDLRYPPAPPR